jgi:glc operon protein GlcG
MLIGASLLANTALAAQDPATRDTFILLKLTTIPGGVPYLGSDGRVLGAVGVSGAQPSQDAGCAEQAVAGAGL